MEKQITIKGNRANSISLQSDTTYSGVLEFDRYCLVKKVPNTENLEFGIWRNEDGERIVLSHLDLLDALGMMSKQEVEEPVSTIISVEIEAGMFLSASEEEEEEEEEKPVKKTTRRKGK